MDSALKMKSTIILMALLVVFGTVFNFLTIKRYIRKRRDEEN
jgi:positive regulator of sigma E activity